MDKFRVGESGSSGSEESLNEVQVQVQNSGEKRETQPKVDVTSDKVKTLPDLSGEIEVLSNDLVPNYPLIFCLQPQS